jgi:hypothetical protein
MKAYWMTLLGLALTLIVVTASVPSTVQAADLQFYQAYASRRGAGVDFTVYSWVSGYYLWRVKFTVKVQEKCYGGLWWCNRVTENRQITLAGDSSLEYSQWYNYGFNKGATVRICVSGFASGAPATKDSFSGCSSSFKVQ